MPQVLIHQQKGYILSQINSTLLDFPIMTEDFTNNYFVSKNDFETLRKVVISTSDSPVKEFQFQNFATQNEAKLNLLRENLEELNQWKERTEQTSQFILNLSDMESKLNILQVCTQEFSEWKQELKKINK